MGSSEAGTRRRVKLYMLNDERQWDDKGTGHVSALYTEQDNMALVVISETDGSYLLESKIQPDTAYQKQQETLIVWSEGENMDLALSFQEKVGCDDVWEKICAVQGKDPSVDITQEVIDESDDVEDADGYASMQSIQPLDLPACELSRLEETVQLVNEAVASPPKCERLVVLLESTNYLNQLIDVFHKAEDLEDLESLHHLYVNGCNWDTGVQPFGRTKHREFLRNEATFKEVLPLHNTDLVTKIHQTYRVQYIQDCCLPPPCLFDEHTLSQLKAFVSINKMDIIRALQEDEEFMRRLFTRLKAADTDLSHRRDLSLFVKEFCSISIQTDQKESFLSCLLQHGALRTAEVLLAIDDRDIKSAALEILQAFIEHQPSVVREFVYRDTAPLRKDDELLITLMINQLLTDPDPELSDAFLLGYMLRILIDPDNMNNSGMIDQASLKAKQLLRITKGQRVNVLAKNNSVGSPNQITSKWYGGTESAVFNELEKIARSSEPCTPVLKARLTRALNPKLVKDDFLPSRVNWVVQSSAVDYLHCMLVFMGWLIKKFKLPARLCISIHDELRYICPKSCADQIALALQISNLFTRTYFAYQLGMRDLPESIAYFSSVEIDTCLRKDPKDDCITPSNPEGIRKGYGIPPGQSLTMQDILNRTGGRLSIK